MADTSIKFGVVTGAPSSLTAEKIQQGKLYFLAGEKNGSIKQGIYGVDPLTSDPSSGVFNLAMFGTGAVADGTGYGLSQYNFDSDASTKLKNLHDASANYLLKTTYVQVDKDSSGYVPMADGSAGTIDSQTGDWVLTFDGSNVDWYKLPENAFKNDNSIYTGTSPINVSGTTISHANSGVTSGRYGDSSSERTLEFGGKFKVVDVSVDEFGHVTDASSYELTLPDKPSTAGIADEAKKTTGMLTFKVNGTDASAFNGSTNTSIDISAGTNISISEETDGVIKISTSNVPTTTEMNTAIQTALTSALKYKGTVDGSASKLPTTHAAGDVYVASASFETTAAETGNAYKVESGDYFISNGTIFNVVNGENQVVNGNNGTNAQLTPGTNNVKIATVDGTDITVNIPALPSIVNTLNDESGALTTSYDTSISSTDNGAYRAGTLTIAGKTHIIYGKDTDTVYVHPASINGTTAVNASDGGDFAFSASNKTLQVITGAQRDASGHISKLIYKDITLPENAYLNDNTVYTHPVVGTTNTQTDTSVLTAVTLNSGTEFTVVNGVYRDASGHVNKVSTTKYTMPASAFTDTKCTSLTLNVDLSADIPTALYADVISNTTITASGSGTGLTGTMTSVRVATQAAVEAAKEAATIYWETL